MRQKCHWQAGFEVKASESNFKLNPSLTREFILHVQTPKHALILTAFDAPLFLAWFFSLAWTPGRVLIATWSLIRARPGSLFFMFWPPSMRLYFWLGSSHWLGLQAECLLQVLSEPDPGVYSSCSNPKTCFNSKRIWLPSTRLFWLGSSHWLRHQAECLLQVESESDPGVYSSCSNPKTCFNSKRVWPPSTRLYFWLGSHWLRLQAKCLLQVLLS